MMFNSNKIKLDFPIFKSNPGLVYLDSTATSLKPKAVIDKLNDYYTKYTANVFRGLYSLSEKATYEYEKTREKVAQFINAKSSNEIIFVRNTTEAINLVAYSWGKQNIRQGDEVITTIMEHHSNFVPWQQLTVESGAVLKVVDITDEGYLKIPNSNNQIPNKFQNSKFQLTNVITKKTKLLTITHISNVLGTINPIKEIIREVKKINPNCLVLVDGAQAVPHIKVDVNDLGCDFYAFSSHKMLGPTGVGVLWGRKELLEKMDPFNFGGEMISKVTLEKTEFKEIPHKFEAGTPHIAGVIGLGAAVDYLNKLGMEKIRGHEIELGKYALDKLKNISNLRLYGPNNIMDKGAVFAFSIRGVHAHDIAQVLDRNKICVRSGHHCAMPLHKYLGISATARASFYMYNTKDDVDKLVEGIGKVKEVFRI